MFSGCFQDVCRIFQDVFRMLRWVLLAWWNLMIISNESMNSNGPKESDDPQLFDDPSYSMIPAIQWSPAIPWSIGSMDFDNPKVYGDTSITDGLVLVWSWERGAKINFPDGCFARGWRTVSWPASSWAVCPWPWSAQMRWWSPLDARMPIFLPRILLA